MNTTLPPINELAARGEMIYRERLRSLLDADHHGEFAVINVDTGEFELAESLFAASERAKARWPNENQLYGVRIGFPTVGRIGGRAVRRSE